MIKREVVDSDSLQQMPHGNLKAWVRITKEAINGWEQIKTTSVREKKKRTLEAKSITKPNKRQRHFIQLQSSKWTAAILSAPRKE